MIAALVAGCDGVAGVADDVDLCAVVVQWSQASLNTSHQQLDRKLVRLRCGICGVFGWQSRTLLMLMLMLAVLGESVVPILALLCCG